MTIRLLSTQLAAKIAAGEVVERPVSVVKELVENSIDAGSSQVIVEIRGGGVALIRVVDNGSGIEPGQVPLAFQRHATSKLTSPADLDAISTLGFRGEALPSIAAVSQIILVTRQPGSDTGWEASLRWGALLSQGPKGCPPGASITVSNLFENVPARRNFLRSPAAESNRIKELTTRFALAYPEVGFQLTIDGRSVLKSPGQGRMEDPLVSVYGAEVAKQLMPVLWEDASSGLKVEGFVSPPSLHRSNRRHITFFVNRRWIRSRMLSIAVEESYHRLLPQGRYPVAILNITVPYPSVDVNVHPTKAEVRFRQGDRVFSATQRAVRGALITASPVPQIHPEPTAGGPSNQPAQPSFISARSSLTRPRPAADAGPSPGAEVETPALRVLGQAGSAYIVAEGPDGIFLLDQHAAHERVLYEKIMREMSQGDPSSQTLLEPVTVEIPPTHSDMARDGWRELASYGFVLESFGDDTCLLRAVPSIFRDSDPAKGLLEVLDMVARETASREGRAEILAASIACHSSVTAGMTLSLEEMREIIALLEAVENPHTCPHGRPTMLHLSSQHLERQFGRR